MDHLKFLSCPLRGLLFIWLNHCICVIHTTHEGLCRAPFSGRKVKGQGHRRRLKFWLSPLRGSLFIWPNHFIGDIHTTHERAMCRAPFSEGKVNGQGHNAFEFWHCPLCWFPQFCRVCLWRHAYLIGLSLPRGVAAIRSLDLLVYIYTHDYFSPTTLYLKCTIL